VARTETKRPRALENVGKSQYRFRDLVVGEGDKQDYNVPCETVTVRGAIIVVDMDLLIDTASCDAQRH
jgi:hypothetical protein